MPDKTVKILILGDSASAEAAARRVNAAFSETDSRLATFANGMIRHGQSMMRAGRSLSTYVTLPLIGIGVQAVKTAADFQKTMNTMGAVAQVPQAQLRKLKDLAIEMGSKTVFSANEAAQAMLELSKSGVSVANIMGGSLKNTLDLATAGDLELAESAKIAANAMNVFGLSGKESQRAVDALAGAANASSADVADLAMALSMGGNAAKSAGLSIEETTAVLAALADQGIKGSDAGTSLKTMLLNLVPTSAKAKEAMKELGVSFVDNNGNIKGITEIAQVLQDRLGGLTQAQQQVALKTMFGTDAYRAARIMMDQGVEGLEKYIKATSESGTAAEVAEGKMKGLPGALEKLKGAAETVLLAIGDRLAPTIEKVAGFLTELGEKFTALPKPAQEFIVLVGALVAAAGPLLFILGGVTKTIGHMVNGFRSLATPGGQTKVLLAELAVMCFNLWNSTQRAADGAGALFDSLGQGQQGMRDFADQVKDITEASGHLRTGISDALGAIFTGAPTAGQEFDALVQRINKAIVETNKLHGATRAIAEAQTLYAMATVEANRAIRDHGTESEITKIAISNQQTAEQNLAAAMELSNIATIELEMSTQSLGETRRMLSGITDGVRTAELNLRAAQRQLIDMQKELRDLEERGITKGREYEETRDAVKRAEIGVRDAQRGVTESTKKLEEAVQAATAEGRLNEGAFTKLATTYGLTHKQVKALIEDTPHLAQNLAEFGGKANLSGEQIGILYKALERLDPAAKKGVDGAKGQIDKLPGHVTAVQGPAYSAAVGIGTSIVSGATAGLRSMVDGFVGATQAMAQQAITAAKQTLDAHSPSRVFIQIGKDLVEGFALGIEQNNNRLQGVLDKSLQRITKHVDAIKSRIKAFSSEIRSGFSDFSDITGALSGIEGGATTGDIAAFLNESFQNASALSNGLQQLEGLGLNRSTLSELAAGGADSLPLINALLEGGQSLVSDVNLYRDAINDIEDGTVRRLRKDEFGNQQEVVSTLKEIAKHIKEMLLKLDKAGATVNINGEGGQINADDIARILHWLSRFG